MENSFLIPVQFQQLLNTEMAYSYRIVPLYKEENFVVFATDSLTISVLESELKIILGYPLKLREESKENIEKYLSINYRKTSDNKVSNIHYTNDFLEKIVITAKEIGSSDIHFEPFENKARVRLRLDGKLKEQFHIAIEEYPVIINKIKIFIFSYN